MAITMTELHQSISFKVSVVGEGCVGKTSLIQKLTQNSFNEAYIKTIGANFVNYDIEIDSDKLQLILWDIAGQDLFAFLKPSFLKGSRLSIIVFSLEDNEAGQVSFDRIGDWLNDVKSHCGDIPIWLFGNKSDLIDLAKIDHTTIQNLVEQKQINGYFITSAKTGSGVQKAFNSIIQYLYETEFH